MKQMFLLIGTFAAFLVSCNKDKSSGTFLDEVLASQRSSLPDVVQLLDLLKQPTDGYFYIKSYATLSTQDFRGPEIVSGGFCYDKTGVLRNAGTLTMGGLQITADSVNIKYDKYGLTGATSLYGQAIPISLSGGNSGLPGFSTTFYCPPMMTVTSPTFSNSSTISAGSSIAWNADANNTNGIGIVLYFDPRDTQNRNLNLSGGSVVKTIHTEDDGLYQFTAQDLAGIPTDAIITLRIGRGNYQKVDCASDYHFGLLSYSVIAHPFKVQ